MKRNIHYGTCIGEFIEYYENGQIFTIGERDSLGRRKGVIKNYHENGQLSQEGTFKVGVLDGPVKTYYENGQLKSESILKDGKLIESKEY